MGQIVLAVAGSAVGIFFTILLVCCIFNNYMPVWFCHKMGWHLQPLQQGFDGCSATGVCPRCGKSVLQDGQGNWFSC